MYFISRNAAMRSHMRLVEKILQRHKMPPQKDTGNLESRNQRKRVTDRLVRIANSILILTGFALLVSTSVLYGRLHAEHKSEHRLTHGEDLAGFTPQEVNIDRKVTTWKAPSELGDWALTPEILSNFEKFNKTSKLWLSVLQRELAFLRIFCHFRTHF